ncbi:cupin domain-containing protein [Paracraurococcus lichenis]|uniref:Cupin domain-containing protein n=1 Tax=Paracraurococcus lichenis TaxID=3064888 RepID=A0ABT9DT05_9PROT|nr:cupin domain-containing protein [Paracraurococcus sp. LOR1-02]MDO9707035.1 cupin domain-containing protein [Paracraurococcus sp. LOR1-02]
MTETLPDFAPILRAPGEGLRNLAFGERLIRIRAAETAGRFALWEEPVPPGWGPPLHVHTREDEFFQVLAGTLRFRCGDRVWEGGAGSTALLPRGVPHAFRNIGAEAAQILVGVTPGGFEEFFVEVAAAGVSDPAAAAAIGAKYGLDFLGPPLEG